MKNKMLFIIGGLALLAASCKKSFLDRPSLNNPTLDTYYNTAEEVNGATAYLYNQAWYNWLDKAFHSIGEVLGGNMLTSAGDPNYGYNTYVLFTVQATDGQLLNAWQAFYKVAGNATVIINTFEQKKASVTSTAYLDLGIAEAKFIRAAAYFNIARVFGDVPIVTDPVELAGSGNYNVPRYFQKDVLRFVLEDLAAAEAGLPDDPYQPGRVTKYSAKGLAAKVYLYLKDYTNAVNKAKEVINSGKYDLFPDYMAMFTKTANNNNIESLFALQWKGDGGYSYSNATQAYEAPSPLLGPDFNTGWSSVIPTIDLIRAYEFGDRRKGWSVMQHGFTNANWKNANFPNGFTYDTTWKDSGDDPFKIKTGTRSNVLKYVIGPKSTGDVFATNGANSMNTYLLRYADILLIYAEGMLGDNATTSDAAALEAFNKVHQRAGLSPVTELTKDLIMHERRVEFAFEGDYWFDVQRQGYAKAKAILEAQERGTYSGDGGTINSTKIKLSDASQLFLPIPASEVVEDPELGKPPVAYY